MVLNPRKLGALAHYANLSYANADAIREAGCRCIVAPKYDLQALVAEWEGYTVKEYGPADAFGHRKKMSVAEDLSNEIKAATGEETLVSDLTYDLRSGIPDFIDRMVAFTFAGMAMDAVQDGKTGLMTAIRNGCYTMAPIPDAKLGPRKVDVATMYNTERYRPAYDRKLGMPMFLMRE